MCARRTVDLRHAGIARSAADPYDVDFPRFGAISGQTKLGIGNYSINYHQNHPSFAVKVPKIDRDRHPAGPLPRDRAARWPPTPADRDAMRPVCARRTVDLRPKVPLDRRFSSIHANLCTPMHQFRHPIAQRYRIDVLQQHMHRAPCLQPFAWS